MFKIFINDKPFIISDGSELIYPDEKPLITQKFLEADIPTYFKHCESMVGEGLHVVTKNPYEAFNAIKKQLMLIEAAGGAVFNNNNQLLLIKRLGKWDLPKGKIDAGETAEMAAIREVEEECSINKIVLKNFITTTYHTYKMYNHRFLKITQWYIMSTAFTGTPMPQKEEQITAVKWFNPKNLNINTLDTYNSIKDLLKIILIQTKN